MSCKVKCPIRGFESYEAIVYLRRQNVCHRRGMLVCHETNMYHEK